MKRNGKQKAVAYYRTSSAANVGEDKDSLKRQHKAVGRMRREQGLRSSSRSMTQR